MKLSKQLLCSYCLLFLLSLFFASCTNEPEDILKDKINLAIRDDSKVDSQEWQNLVNYIESYKEELDSFYNYDDDTIDEKSLKSEITSIARKRGIKNIEIIANDVQGVIIDKKPNVNVYIENSSSMDGYVKGMTDFEEAVYNFLVDIKISNFSDSLNLNYINSKIIKQGSDVEDFIHKLEPTTFKIKGGDRGKSDIKEVLDSVLIKTNNQNISILITDGIFSPGKGINAEEYLVNQQIGIKGTIDNYLELNPSAAIILYQLESQFSGKYYDKEDNSEIIKSSRPYYIWIIGNLKNLRELKNSVSQDRFKGGGVLNTFTICQSTIKTNYSIKRGSGNFELDRKNPKTKIIDLQKDEKGKNDNVRFSINVDFSQLLLDDNYLQDPSNYELSNKDYTLSVTKAIPNSMGYTHQLNYVSDNVHKGLLSTKLKSKIPDWIKEANDSIGNSPLAGKTYGIEKQILGVYEAFTFEKDYYTEININIE